MFTNIYLKNFKFFDEINFNMCNKANDPKKLIVIYGKNGSGKSNIISSFAFIKDSIISLRDSVINTILLNSTQLSDQFIEKIKESEDDRYFKKYRTVGLSSDDESVAEYNFLIDEKIATYKIVFNDNEIIEESLVCALDERRVCVFKLSKEKSAEIKGTITKDSDFLRDLYLDVKRYWGKHSFFAILFKECTEKNISFALGSLNDSFRNVFLFLIKYVCKINGTESVKLDFLHTDSYFSDPRSGKINSEKRDVLEQASQVLGSFLNSVDKSIIGAYYKFIPFNNKLEYKLYIRKLKKGKEIEIDNDDESNGTKSLIDLFFLILESCANNTVVLDECDSMIHDLLFRSIVEYIYPYVNGQLIFSTHNTYLLDVDEIARKSAYIIGFNDDSQYIMPIGKNRNRIYKDNSARKKYISGEFDGIPQTTTIDFEKASENFKTLQKLLFTK